MVALARSLSVTTVHKVRDPNAPRDDRTGFRIVGEEFSPQRPPATRVPDAAELDLIIVEPPQEWLDEKCGY